MTVDEFREILVRHGMTLGDAARFLDRDFSLVRRWAAGKRAIPEEAAERLRQLDRGRSGQG